MKKALALIMIPVLVLGLAVLGSCKNRSEKKEQKIVEMSQVKTIENEIEKNVYPLPTSAEVIKMLSELEVGQKATIRQFEDDEIFLKLMEMGFIPGENVMIEQVAPLGDPIAIQIAGYQVSLRLNEASKIIVEPIIHI